MRSLRRLYAYVVDGLACLAGAMLVVMFVSVIVDVLVRESGFQPPEWAVPLSEYLLLYSTLFGAPWLLRRKGHVFVDLLVKRLRGRSRRWFECALYLVCFAACALIAIVALDSTWREYSAGSSDVRALLIPKWLLFFPLVPGFGLMAIEFLRFASGRDSLYEQVDGQGLG